MPSLFRPPGAFWKAWFRVSLQLFVHMLAALCVAWAVLGWALTCVAAPSPPCGPAQPGSAAEAEDGWGCACPAPAVRSE